jgi:tetraacyldisaccharide 4'-kinase
MSALRGQLTAGLDALWYRGVPLYWLLWPVSLVYRALVAVRRAGFRSGVLRSFDAGVPVVVVGNLTVGGTGKTPLVVWLAGRLRERGFRVGVICRGYRGTATDWPRIVAADSDADVVGDEATLLARRTGCPVAAGPDRVAAAVLLTRSRSLDVILSDDGLQHYRMRRAAEIAVIDGSRGLGNGLCLPAGPLREPAARLGEVDAVVVNQGSFGTARSLSAGVRIQCLRELRTGQERAPDAFRGQSVHAVAAIGNPGRFFALLRAQGLDVEGHALPDHSRLESRDLVFGDDRPVLITEKDAVKCEAFAPANCWCVVAELEFSSADGQRLENDIVSILEQDPVNR